MDGGWVSTALKPFIDDITEELFGPEQAGVALAADQAFVRRDAFGDDCLVEGIALGDALGEGFIEMFEACGAVGFSGGMEAAADGD